MASSSSSAQQQHVPVSPSVSSSASSSSSTSSPCAACKFLRRKCQPDCVFAPYFPPDQPQKFVHVHRVFGASNVTKLLNELHPYQREDAVNSLAYEADMRLRDPVYGCVGVISLLQHQLRQLQLDLSCAKSELSKYQSAAAAAAAGAGTSSAAFPPTAASAVGHGFINVSSHPIGTTVFGLGRDQAALFPAATTAARVDPATQMMLRNYDADLAARLGGANGAYDAGLAAATIGLFGGQFSKPSATGMDERSGISPL